MCRCRTRQEDRDLYDFKLKCGNRWTSWSGLWFKNEVEDKEWECPSKMYVTGMEVKRGRREFGDRDTYDFKLQCSGVWQSYMGMKFAGHQEEKHQECPNGEGTSGLKVFRGFIEWGDKDMYEYDLNCKSIAQNLASIRGLPDLKMLGLPRNVLVWDGEQLATWLDALGLSHVAPAFLDHNINGGTVFLLTEDHLRDLGLTVVGDRLYFIDLLTQLCAACPPGTTTTPRMDAPPPSPTWTLTRTHTHTHASGSRWTRAHTWPSSSSCSSCSLPVALIHVVYAASLLRAADTTTSSHGRARSACSSRRTRCRRCAR